MIGIVIAMESEAAPFLKGGFIKEKSIHNRKFFTVSLGDSEAVVAVSGIGKVNAAYTTGLLIEHFAPDVILNCGVSGGIGDGIKVLDLVVVESCVQHDVDTTGLGDPIGMVSTVNRIYFETDKKYSDIFDKSLPRGIAASGEQFVASYDKKKEIADRFNAIICDMESGAIAQCAYIAGIPYVCLRCVSDLADEAATMSFTELCDIASDKIYSAVQDFAYKLNNLIK